MTSLNPKKSLGQHWLNDEDSLEAMCQAVEVGQGDTVLEIGPGLGSLTEFLLSRAKQVLAVELDTDLAASLQSRRLKNLKVLNEDILNFDFSKLPAGYKVVANIPYYLTSNLVRVLSETANSPKAIAILVQKEVAQRAAASPGDMSILAVTAQFFWQVGLGRDVPAKLFTPSPKVDSQILVLNKRKEPLYSDVDTKQFFRLVKAGFSQKRKTLHNSLSGGLAINKAESKSMLEKAKIDPRTRAQALSLDNWFSLYRVYNSSS